MLKTTSQTILLRKPGAFPTTLQTALNKTPNALQQNRLLRSPRRFYRQHIPLRFSTPKASTQRSYLNITRIHSDIFSSCVLGGIFGYWGYVVSQRGDSDMLRYLRATAENVVAPLLEQQAQREQTPWFERLDLEDDYDYQEARRIVRAELEAAGDVERLAILNEDRPWKLRREVEKKRRIEKFAAYPNYYKASVEEANREEDE